ncbi:alpha/beta-hydrolase [Biscogniauxia marginata]|nr:alpha/beta-hydrolase [Biscogniauxia marginata]
MAGVEVSIVLIHGAYHPASAWGRVIPQLQAKNYRCLAPQICFCGTEKPIASWQTCVDQIQEIIAQETSAGRLVVIVNHSLGGIPGCSAVEGFTKKNPVRLGKTKGRVVGIIQVTAMAILDAAHLREFYSRVSTSKPNTHRNEIGWKSPPVDAKQTFYNDLVPEDAEYWCSKLMPNSALLDNCTEGLYPGFKDVPVQCIVCTKDLRLTTTMQEEFIDVIRATNGDLTVRKLDSGHCPLLGRPVELAEIIDEACMAFSSKCQQEQ